MQYLTSVGTETIYREYKSFSFQHIGIPFDDDQVAEYLTNYQWDFNHLIEQSLEKYWRIYLPKYMSAFFDPYTPSDTDGTLYIGINDEGLVTGIPYSGQLTKELVMTNRNRAYLLEHILAEGKDIKNVTDVIDRLDFDIIPVTYVDQVLPSRHPHLIEYYKRKKELEDRINEHSKKYTEWQRQNDLYSQKLVELYSIPECRSGFIRYLRKHKQYEMIRSIKNGAVIEQQKYDKIREFRESGDNLYSWLCQWKDETLDRIRNKKPLREKSYKNIIYRLQAIYKPIHMFAKVEDLIPWWMQNNKDLSLYVIRFTFKKIGYHPLTDIRFIDYLKREVRCYRTISENQPCCLPY
jgi:hypothetical protein